MLQFRFRFLVFSMFLAVGLKVICAQTEFVEPRVPEAEESSFHFQRQAPRSAETAESPILSKQLYKVVVRSSEEQRAHGELVISGLSLHWKDSLEKQFGELLGEPLTENELDSLLELLIQEYELQGFPVVDLQVNAEILEKGVLEIVVVEGRIGKVALQQSQHFSDEQLAKGILLRRGDVLTAGSLLENLDWLSRNPFRQVVTSVAPGEEFGEVDFLLQLQEQKPWRVYAGFENTGTETLGQWRYLLGGLWGNGFNKDQLLSYQFTTGDSINRFRAHSLSWQIPLQKFHDAIRITVLHARAETDRLFSNGLLESEGDIWQLSLAYEWGVMRTKKLRWMASLSAELKQFDNLLFFGDGPVTDSQVDVVQVRFSNRWTWKMEDVKVRAFADLVLSPGGITGNNDDRSFLLLEPGAEAQYSYLLTGLDLEKSFDAGYDWFIKFRGQFATGPLLSSEGVNLGGWQAVRGYSQGDVIVSDALLLTQELYSPPLDLAVGKLRGLVFSDAAVGWEEEDRTERANLGLGLRWLGQSFTFRADYARNTDGDGRWALGLNVYY